MAGTASRVSCLQALCYWVMIVPGVACVLLVGGSIGYWVRKLERDNMRTFIPCQESNQELSQCCIGLSWFTDKTRIQYSQHSDTKAPCYLARVGFDLALHNFVQGPLLDC
mmetsp:Transcript_34324/g.83029  ORF Transcript_34324/g.83029 Transcript_34324/m.83029 type:complete len:110 (+) Transcript_34324:456-785(+)